MNANTPGARWHSVEVMTFDGSGDPKKRTVEGDDVWCAAALRALADQLDPPKVRPGLRDAPRDAGAMVRRSPAGMVALPPPSDVPRADPMSLR